MAVDLGRVGRMHAGMVGATGGLAYATHIGEPFSLFLGGAVMGANYALLRVMAGYLCSPTVDAQNRRRVAFTIGAFVLKFGIFLALLAAMFVRLPIEGLSFAVGATPLIVAFVVEALRNDREPIKGVS